MRRGSAADRMSRQRVKRAQQQQRYGTVESGMYRLRCDDCDVEFSTSSDSRRAGFHREHTDDGHDTDEHYFDR